MDPVMFHLKGLFEDGDFAGIDRRQRVCHAGRRHQRPDLLDDISLWDNSRRQCRGRSTALGPSPTNSVLLLQKRSGIFRGRPKRSSRASRIREPP